MCVVGENGYALDFGGTEVTGVDFDEGLAGLCADALFRLARAFPARIVDKHRIIVSVLCLEDDRISRHGWGASGDAQGK